MTTERLTKLLEPFLGEARLSEAQLQQLSTHFALLLKWNARTNLTAISDPEEVITRHFGESLLSARLLFAPGSNESVIDVGSGAGFPGFPFKIWSPNIELTLVESNQKKAVFLKEVARALRLTGTTVLADRAEQLKLQAKVVSLRAVERFEAILPVARRLLASEGRIALLIGSSQADRAKSILADVDWEPAVPMPASASRLLLVGRTA
jgi:16S rRNA (guanine527-N7)-methyltransferase